MSLLKFSKNNDVATSYPPPYNWLRTSTLILTSKSLNWIKCIFFLLARISYLYHCTGLTNRMTPVYLTFKEINTTYLAFSVLNVVYLKDSWTN